MKTQQVGYNNEWNKNTGYKSTWKKDPTVAQKYFCNNCLEEFEEKPQQGNLTKERLKVHIDFKEWDYDILSKFVTKRGKAGCFIKIYKLNGATYLGTAFGQIAQDFIDRDLSQHKHEVWGELGFDKNMEFKIFFND